MQEIRILVIGAPGILRDVVVGVVRGCADMTVVDVGADPAAMSERFNATAVDVVVCSLDASTAADIGASLFEPYERTKVIALRDDGRRGVLWELRAQRTELGELSLPRLVETIRRRSG